MALAVSTPARYHFTRREYYAMGDAGLFPESVPVELIAGDIIQHPRKTPLHASVVMRLNMVWFPGLADRAIVGVHQPVVISDDTEPEPDLTLAVPRSDYYSGAHPGPQDILLAVEVSEASLRYDREVKAPLYGQAGILEMWLLDLAARELIVYRTPSDIGYRSQLRLKSGDQVSPLAFPDLILEVAALLPPTEHGS